MACFYSIFGCMSVNSQDSFDDERFDLIGSLPFEIAANIFRLLPGQDLLNSATVCKTWNEICKNDKKLRKKLRGHIKRDKRNRVKRIVRDDFGSDFVSKKPPRTAFMATVTNLVFSSRPKPASYNYDQEGRAHANSAPYLKGTKDKHKRPLDIPISVKGKKRFRL